jgi:hypothetical protein
MMKPQDQADYLAKKESLLRKFAEKNKRISKRGVEKAALKLTAELIALQRNLNIKDPTVRERLEKYAMDEMAKFDPDRADLTYSAKLLRVLAKNKAGSGANYLEDLKTHEANLEGEKQSNRAKAKREMNNLDTLILQLLKSNSELTIQEVYYAIKDAKNEWPINQVDDMYIEVFKSKDKDDLKRYKVSGLGSRITKLKKML